MDAPGCTASANGSPFNPNDSAALYCAGNPGTSSLAQATTTTAVSPYDTGCLRRTAEVMRQ